MEEFSMKANLDRLRVSEALEYSNKVNEDRGRCAPSGILICALAFSFLLMLKLSIDVFTFINEERTKEL